MIFAWRGAHVYIGRRDACAGLVLAVVPDIIIIIIFIIGIRHIPIIRCQILSARAAAKDT